MEALGSMATGVLCTWLLLFFLGAGENLALRNFIDNHFYLIVVFGALMGLFAKTILINICNFSMTIIDKSIDNGLFNKIISKKAVFDYNKSYQKVTELIGMKSKDIGFILGRPNEINESVDNGYQVWTYKYTEEADDGRILKLYYFYLFFDEKLILKRVESQIV